MSNIVLPFDQHIPSFQSSIRDNHVTVISASTGSGKSVRGPVAALHQLILNGSKRARIFVTVPTIIATKGLCKYQSEVLNPDIKFGWAGGSVVQYNDSTQIVYTTTGHLVSRILHSLKDKQRNNNANWVSSGVIDFCELCFVDEAHIATTENYVILHLLQYLLEHQPKLTPKIIISSATISLTNIEVLFPSCSILNFEMPRYPVEIRFSHTDFDLFPSTMPLDVAIVNLVVDIHCKTKKINNDGKPNGDILIFCAGSQHVEQIVMMLYERQELETLEVLRAYSTLHSDELDQLTSKERYPGTDRRVIVSTNIAESSLTIDGLGYVIDSLLEKVLICTNDNTGIGDNTLTLQRISVASAMQRKGRTGRTMPGIYYPMCREFTFNYTLPKHLSNEFDRTDISETLLQFLALQLDAKTILKISDHRFHLTINNLCKLKMIEREKSDHPQQNNLSSDEEAYDSDSSCNSEFSAYLAYEETKKIEASNNGAYKVTEAGFFCPKLPISLSHAYWIYCSIKTDLNTKKKTLDHQLIQLIAVLEVLQNNQSFQFIPSQDHKGKESSDHYSERVAAHKTKHYEKFRGDCDLSTLLNIYHAAEAYFKKNPDIRTQKRWCIDNCLQFKLLQQAQRKSLNLAKILHGISISNSPKSLDDVKQVYRQIYPEHELTVQKFDKKGRVVLVDSCGKQYFLNNKTHFSNMDFMPGDIVYAVSRKHVSKGGPPLNFASFVF